MVSRSILVPPRLFLGVIFSVAVSAKFTAPVPFAVILPGFLGKLLPQAHPLYQTFANAVVLPHITAVAAAVMAGETFVAITMLFGIATRAGAFVAVCLLINYMLAKGMTLWTPASNDAADIIIATVVGIGAAGRTFGADRILAERWPRVLLW